VTAPPTPAWLRVDDVKAWLNLTDTAEDALVSASAAAVEPHVQRSRADQWATPADGPPVYTPDAEVYQAAVMLAARTYRRRNSTAGVETFGDSVAYVARYDPDVQRALREASWAFPAVG